MKYNKYYFANTNNQDIYKNMRRMAIEPKDKNSENIFVYPDNLENALSLIQQALAGETEDKIFYTYLFENAPTEEDKQIITGIRNNEINHYNLFRQIFSDLTGAKMPKGKPESFVPPKTYCDGLKRALLGEQNAVRKYRQILYAMQSRIHINMLVEIITDEIRHGILYNYLYSKNGCES
ncbi:MAG: ferritin-like domain-containing protein [Anaerocolumna sp.]